MKPSIAETDAHRTVTTHAQRPGQYQVVKQKTSESLTDDEPVGDGCEKRAGTGT